MLSWWVVINSGWGSIRSFFFFPNFWFQKLVNREFHSKKKSQLGGFNIGKIKISLEFLVWLLGFWVAFLMMSEDGGNQNQSSCFFLLIGWKCIYIKCKFLALDVKNLCLFVGWKLLHHSRCPPLLLLACLLTIWLKWPRTSHI